MDMNLNDLLERAELLKVIKELKFRMYTTMILGLIALGIEIAILCTMENALKLFVVIFLFMFSDNCSKSINKLNDKYKTLSRYIKKGE